MAIYFCDDIIRILLITALPKGESRFIDVEKECNNIKIKLEESTNSRSFDIKEVNGATPSLIEEAINTYHPHIIHFACHGDKKGNGIIAETSEREGVIVTPEELVHYFQPDQSLQFVFLNACYSSTVAEIISRKLTNITLIGVNDKIDSYLAQSFSLEFYKVLFSGRSYYDSFDIAKNNYRDNSKGDCELIIQQSKIQGLNPLLIWSELPESLSTAKPEGDTIPSVIKHGEDSYTFNEFAIEILDTQMQNSKRPVVITGEAFSGKTAILSLFFEAHRKHYPILYIRTSELDYHPQNINKAKEERPNSNELWETSLNDIVKRLSLDGTVIIIDAIDNLNREKKGINYGDIDDHLVADINVLRMLCKNRLIATSRTIPPIFKKTFDEYNILKLSRKYVKAYLNKYKDKLIERKFNTNSGSEMLQLSDTLSTAGLLKDFIYDIIGDYYIDPLLSTRHIETPTTRGEILWNYFCIEMLRMRDSDGRGTPLRDGAKALFLLRYIAPYIAFNIIPENTLKIKSYQFKKLVNEAKDMYRETTHIFDDIDRITDKYGTKFFDEISENSIQPLMVETYHLVRPQKEDNSYEFIHQIYAEVLYAIHVQNQMLLGNTKIFNNELTPELIAMLSDILQEHKTFSIEVR